MLSIKIPGLDFRLPLPVDNAGQSAIEYLVVTFILVAVLITTPSIYDSASGVMKNKYHSYAFGVAISDPPRKAFDDTVENNTDKITRIFDMINEIEELIEGSIDELIDEMKDIRMPSFDDIKKLFKKVTHDISKAVDDL